MEEKPESWWSKFRRRAVRSGEKFEEVTRKWCTSKKVKETSGKIAEEGRECVDSCKRTLSKFRRKD